jgi:hypothetical protein
MLSRVGRLILAALLIACACTTPKAATPVPAPAAAAEGPLENDPIDMRASRRAATVDESLRCAERLAVPAIADVVDLRWAPDSRSLAITRFVRVPSRSFVTGYEEQRRLSILDLATGALRDVNIATHPDWSASGQLLSFWRDENRGKEDEFLRIVRDGRTVALVDSTQPDGRWIGEEFFHWFDSEIRAWKDGKLRTVAKIEQFAPRFPADDTAFSADGSLFTLTRYGALSGTVRRFIGVTRTGELTPIDEPSIAHTEWSPRGATLLLRSAERATLRGADGSLYTVTLEPGATVHGWTADGRLLVGAVSPTVPGGNALDQFAVVGGNTLATLPNLMGSRTYSPDGSLFAGVSRTGLTSTQLEIFRCGGTGSTDPRADPAARAGAQRIEGETQRFVRPVAGAITQYVQGRHTGIDVAAPNGSIVYAADDGLVNAAETSQFGGFRVCVDHGRGLESCAYHSSLSLVRVGDRVVRGQPIALVGMTGITRGPHTHWEAKVNGEIVDPLSR